MRYTQIFSICVFLFCGACVDRIAFDIDEPSVYPVTIDGFISDQPGPYTIELTRSFDIESKTSFKTQVSAKRVEILDDQGFKEVLTQIKQGVYQTDPAGIQGKVGRSYRVRIELLDGKIYESIPETLQASGDIESVYFDYNESKDSNGANTYGFDVLFDSNAGGNDAYYFLWKFVGTFQAETNPELYEETCGESRCPKPRPCSGYIVGSTGSLEQVSECECCTCWYNIQNDVPIVSDNQFVEGGEFKSVKAGYVPINQWTFMHKVHAEVQQRSLSRRAFDFWRAIKDQKEATTSLFQPISGKIKGNFVQISGEALPMEGLFYATSIISKSIYITRNDVPNQSVIPTQDLPFKESCLFLFPNSTTEKPASWE